MQILFSPRSSARCLKKKSMGIRTLPDT